MGEDDSSRERFVREARAAASLSDCDHVVTIYDVGEHAGRTFIVMEYFGGGTLADRMRGPGLVPHHTALRWLEEAATALDCAHDHGIVHRDIKPANLLLDDGDRLAVADFGIAHVADATRQLTVAGTVLGTAAYLSPEQALGEPATSASDRYALAVVAFELLCGERPYRAEHTAAQARQHVEAEVPRITDRAPHLPPAVDVVLARGLAKDAAERPATAGQLVAELERALREPAPVPTQATQRIVRPTARRRAPRAPGTADRRTPVSASRPGARRGRRPILVALVALAALVAAGTVLALTAGGGDEPERGAAGTTAPRAQRTSTARDTGARTSAVTTRAPAAPATQPAPATEAPPARHRPPSPRRRSLADPAQRSGVRAQSAGTLRGGGPAAAGRRRHVPRPGAHQGAGLRLRALQPGLRAGPRGAGRGRRPAAAGAPARLGQPARRRAARARTHPARDPLSAPVDVPDPTWRL